PAAVRTHSFAKTVRQWRHSDSTVRSEAVTISLDIASPRPAQGQHAAIDREVTRNTPALGTPRLHASPLVMHDAQAAADSAVTAAEPIPLPNNGPLPQAADRIPRPLPVAPFVETDLGGLFYLINVGLFLELYGDFTSPLRPGI